MFLRGINAFVTNKEVWENPKTRERKVMFATKVLAKSNGGWAIVHVHTGDGSQIEVNPNGQMKRKWRLYCMSYMCTNRIITSSVVNTLTPTTLNTPQLHSTTQSRTASAPWGSSAGPGSRARGKTSSAPARWAGCWAAAGVPAASAGRRAASRRTGGSSAPSPPRTATAS